PTTHPLSQVRLSLLPVYGYKSARAQSDLSSNPEGLPHVDFSLPSAHPDPWNRPSSDRCLAAPFAQVDASLPLVAAAGPFADCRGHRGRAARPASAGESPGGPGAG